MKESVLRFWPQWLAALTVTLLSTSMGMSVGWTSPYLAQLTSADAKIRISDDEASWVASLLPLGRLFGAALSVICVEFLGSKVTLTTAGIPLMLSWISIMFADSIIWLYVARISSGTSIGMFFGCFPLYMGEISEPAIRGGLVGLVVNGLPLGTLLGNVMGPYLSMMWFGIISLVLAVCFMTIFPFLPQSPHYLIQQNSMKKAEASLRWYCRKQDMSSELAAAEKFIRASTSTGFYQKMRHIIEPKNRRSFIIIIVLFTFMQLSGLNTIVFYMEIILRRAEVTSIAPSTIVIIVNAISILIGWLSMYAVDHCGRKLLLAVSSGGVSIAMFLLGVHFEFLSRDFDPMSIEWLPILSLMIFPLVCLGFIPIPSTMLSELFPSDLKSVAGFVGSMTSALLAFGSSKTYQPLVDALSDQYVFWMYAIIMAGCVIFSLVAIPETKGKTLQEIQEMLTKESAAKRPTTPAQPVENSTPHVDHKRY